MSQDQRRSDRPLAPDIRALLAYEKDATASPPGAKARVFGRVEALLLPPPGGGGDGPGGAAPPAPSAPPSVAAPPMWPLVAKPASIAAAFVLGGVSAVVAWHSLTPPKEKVVFIDRMVQVPPPAHPAPANTGSTGVDIELSDTSTRAAPKPMAAPHAGDLAEERALLDVARVALQRGDGAGTLAALAKHEKRFANGHFVEEREALYVHALVLSERYDEARSRAGRFREKHPGSVLLPAIDAALDAIP